MALILLSPHNRILDDLITPRLRGLVDTKEPLDVRVCDYDDVSYHILIKPEETGILYVNLVCACYEDLKNNHLYEELKNIYGSYLMENPAAGANVTLRIDLNQKIENVESLSKEITLLKCNVLGGPLSYYLSKLQLGQSDQPTKIMIRNDTILHIFPKSDRVTIVYMLDFHEKSDLVIGQSFVEARRSVPTAPICTFDVKPPVDMKFFNIDQPIGTVGFLSITLLSDHVKNNEKKLQAVQMLHMLRNYVQYHIKCSKAYFHSRMRARVVELLKVMNRAHIESLVVKTQKTSTGRTFVRSE